MGFNGIGMTELIIVLVIALIVLGPKRLPEAGRSLGRGMREFKDSISGGGDRDRHRDDDDDFDAIDAPPRETAAPKSESAKSTTPN